MLLNPTSNLPAVRNEPCGQQRLLGHPRPGGLVDPPQASAHRALRLQQQRDAAGLADVVGRVSTGKLPSLMNWHWGFDVKTRHPDNWATWQPKTRHILVLIFRPKMRWGLGKPRHLDNGGGLANGCPPQPVTGWPTLSLSFMGFGETPSHFGHVWLLQFAIAFEAPTRHSLRDARRNPVASSGMLGKTPSQVQACSAKPRHT